MATVKIINHSKRHTNSVYKKIGLKEKPKYHTYYVFAKIIKGNDESIKNQLREARKIYRYVALRDVFDKKTKTFTTQILGRKLF